MHPSFAAGVAILLSIGLPVAADETPKRGGTLMSTPERKCVNGPE
jgi:hypothetical protein